jgi:hypothetical protein
MKKQLVSIQRIIAKVYRDLNIVDESRFMDMYEWVGEAIQEIRVHTQFLKRTEDIEVKHYAGCLPRDMYCLLSVLHQGLAIVEDLSTLSRGIHYSKQPVYDLSTVDNASLNVDNPLASSALFNYRPPREGYYIENGHIITNFQHGLATITYNAIPLDEQGFIMVPDDHYYQEAIFWYIAMKLKLPNMFSGKQNAMQEYQICEQHFEKYKYKARGSGNQMSIDETQSMVNFLTRLKPDISAHSKSFTSASKQQIIG